MNSPLRQGGWGLQLPLHFLLSSSPIPNKQTNKQTMFFFVAVKYYGKQTSSVEKPPLKTDQDTLRLGYRFIRTEEDDMDPSWEQRLVKRYYDKLFKEYPYFSFVPLV